MIFLIMKVCIILSFKNYTIKMNGESCKLPVLCYVFEQGDCGLRHLAFCVDSVEQTVNELAEVGIECEPIRVDDYTGKKMTFFHDPDGLPLELHE